ncbi:hypothetical protein B0H16DRAFT_1692594 [Mycena metata]|uniref:Uncharacterized protein n=1 Tax=Mycena metata TaxID=1033252 RepID=A0AAD7IND0_9AGAR|nr:hypothetical protein B0H16DRAFT_1692594 [Mycena metata]
MSAKTALSSASRPTCYDTTQDTEDHVGSEGVSAPDHGGGIRSPEEGYREPLRVATSVPVRRHEWEMLKVMRTFFAGSCRRLSIQPHETRVSLLPDRESLRDMHGCTGSTAALLCPWPRPPQSRMCIHLPLDMNSSAATGRQRPSSVQEYVAGRSPGHDVAEKRRQTETIATAADTARCALRGNRRNASRAGGGLEGSCSSSFVLVFVTRTHGCFIEYFHAPGTEYALAALLCQDFSDSRHPGDGALDRHGLKVRRQHGRQALSIAAKEAAKPPGLREVNNVDVVWNATESDKSAKANIAGVLVWLHRQRGHKVS